MKIVLQVALWVVIAFLGYKVYDSVYSRVEFEEVKEKRFAVAVKQLKEIRRAQNAHKVVTGKYARDFESLAQFIDTAQFPITQRRDSSFTRYDKDFRIDRSVDTVIVDILGYESVKDSLFKDSDDYKHLSEVKLEDGKTANITLRTAAVEKNDILYPVFKAEIKKRDLLYGQPEGYLREEDQANSIEEINGDAIYVGSLDEVSTNGNWPIVYDKKDK